MLCAKDGKRMIILPPGFTLPSDLEPSHGVPGLGTDMDPVVIPGGYTADFKGITYQVNSMNLTYTYNCCFMI